MWSDALSEQLISDRRGRLTTFYVVYSQAPSGGVEVARFFANERSQAIEFADLCRGPAVVRLEDVFVVYGNGKLSGEALAS